MTNSADGSRQRQHLGRRTGRLTLAGFAVVLVALLGAFSMLIAESEATERELLAARFETRAELSVSFAKDFVTGLSEREISQAERLLGAAVVTQAEFEVVAQSFGFEAAVLLDQRGGLTHVWPARPELIGRDMTLDYAHLRAAVAGRVGVSGVVPSAAEEVPIVAVAVPFRSAYGWRVFSGAITPATSPLGSYLGSAVPIRGGAAFLVDSAGAVIASSPGAVFAPVFADLPNGVTTVDGPFGEVTAAVAEGPGLAWRVVLMAPTDELYAPVAGVPWLSWLLFVLFAITGTVAMGLFYRLQREWASAEGAARTDALTGIANRRSMQESLDHAVALAGRHGTPFAALLIDIDRFKTVNDTYGHDAGDTVIRSVAGTLTIAARDVDRVARWGGEEFLVLLHHTDGDAAMVAAQRIRRAVTATHLPAPLADLKLTVSIGVAVLSDRDTDEMIRQADAALYSAKSNGRNRVESATSTDCDDELVVLVT